MTLGKRLKLIRKDNNYRLIDVHEGTGLSLPYISELENNKSNPSIKTMEALAIFYRMTVGDLLADIDDMNDKRNILDRCPEPLLRLVTDPEYAGEFDEDWIELMLTIKYRGRTPKTMQDYLSLYLFFRRFFTGSVDVR